MTTRLFIGKHGVPDFMRVQIFAAGIDKRRRIGLQHARNEAVAHQFTLPIAPVGVKAVANDGLAVTYNVRDDCDQAQVHFAKVDVGITDGGTDG